MGPWDHPEMYLPPNLPGSTPKKAAIAHLNAEGDFPDLEAMGHKDLVDLVKRLLEERASKPPQLTNPNKDATVAGHVTMNQESFVQSSQAILQGLADGGYIHAKPQSLNTSLEMIKRTNWTLICGKDKFCLLPQLTQVQLLSKL